MKCENCGSDSLKIAGPYAVWCSDCGTLVREIAKTTMVPTLVANTPIQVLRLFKQTRDDELPKDLDRLNKLRFDHIENGMRIYWYYQEDLDYTERWCYREAGDALKALHEQPPFSGILAVLPDRDTSVIDWDDVILVVDRYPTEKCWPLSDWMSLGELLEQYNLVEVFTK